MKIDAIILDDEPGNIVTLTELLKTYCADVNIIATSQSPVEGKELILNLKPQLVFLDIEMPFMNAFDLLDSLKPISFEIIFITAFQSYAIKAFKYSAIDYSLKPISIDELKEAVSKVYKRMVEKNINQRVETLLTGLKTDTVGKKIVLPFNNSLLFEDVDTISYLAASGSYTYVHFENKKKELVSKTLKEFEDMLPSEQFCRVHNSYLINLKYIKKYIKGRGGFVEMNDGTMIEVSARKKDDFLKLFKL